MFTQIFKKHQDSEEEYKKRILDRANHIIRDFFEEDITTAEMIDTLQTIQHHVQKKQLNVKTSLLFAKDYVQSELPKTE